MYHKRSIFCKVLGDIIKWIVKIALSVSEIATISTVSKLRNVKKKIEVKHAIWFVECFFFCARERAYLAFQEDYGNRVVKR